MDEKAKILIIRLSALGDTIHTIPLAAAIREAYSNCEIGWVVEDKAKHFIKDNPLIDKTFVIPKKKWRKRGFSIKNLWEFFVIIRNIRKEKYDIVLDTQQLFKSGIIMGLSGAKRRIAHSDGREFSEIFANEIIESDRKQFDINYHVVNRNLDMAKYLGINTDEIKFVLPESSQEAVEKAKFLLKDIEAEKRVVVLSPATTWGNKHIENDYWSFLIAEYSNRTNIVITGSEADVDLVNSILEPVNDKKILNLTGQTNLEELTELFKLVDLLITPDSGSAHIAWAVQKPKIITFFTATSKNRTAPIGPKYHALASKNECSPCMKKKCRLDINKNMCTSKFNLEEIINIVNKFLSL